MSYYEPEEMISDWVVYKFIGEWNKIIGIQIYNCGRHDYGENN